MTRTFIDVDWCELEVRTLMAITQSQANEEKHWYTDRWQTACKREVRYDTPDTPPPHTITCLPCLRNKVSQYASAAKRLVELLLDETSPAFMASLDAWVKGGCLLCAGPDRGVKYIGHRECVSYVGVETLHKLHARIAKAGYDTDHPPHRRKLKATIDPVTGSPAAGAAPSFGLIAFVESWFEGGCLLCGKADRAGMPMAHPDCYKRAAAAHYGDDSFKLQERLNQVVEEHGFSAKKYDRSKLKLWIKEWNAGGCLLCGKADREGRNFAHDACFEQFWRDCETMTRSVVVLMLHSVLCHLGYTDRTNAAGDYQAVRVHALPAKKEEENVLKAITVPPRVTYHFAAWDKGGCLLCGVSSRGQYDAFAHYRCFEAFAREHFANDPVKASRVLRDALVANGRELWPANEPEIPAANYFLSEWDRGGCLLCAGTFGCGRDGQAYAHLECLRRFSDEHCRGSYRSAHIVLKRVLAKNGRKLEHSDPSSALTKEWNEVLKQVASSSTRIITKDMLATKLLGWAREVPTNALSAPMRAQLLEIERMFRALYVQPTEGDQVGAWRGTACEVAVRGYDD